MSSLAESVRFPDEPVHVALRNASVVQDKFWQLLQRRQYDAMRTLGVEHERASQIVRLDDPMGYASSRKDPNLNVGDRWRARQLFAQPSVAVVRLSGKIAAGIVTANNTSSSVEGRGVVGNALAYAETRAKMLTPPALDMVPKVGGKKYVHLREVYFADHEYEDDGVGIALIGLYRALELRHRKQPLAAYKVDNVADAEMIALTSLVGMRPTGSSQENMPGYPQNTTVIRMQGTVGDAMERILEFPGAQAAIDASY